MGKKSIFAETNMVSIPDWEYEDLVRQSERLEILKEYARNHKYISAEDMMILLGIAKEGEE